MLQRVSSLGREIEVQRSQVEIAQQRISELNAASSLTALSPLKSVGLHKLKGDRADFWAITINGPWRLVFRFKDSNAYDVEISDYHLIEKSRERY